MARAPAPRPRIDDVARAAGVSTATVDRVLNQRSGVRSATAHRVLSVAGQLGYLPQRDLYASLRPKPMQLSFVLPTGTNRYLHMLGDTINRAADTLAPFNVRCRCLTTEGFDPQASRLLRLARNSDGVAFMPLEHPVVREAVNTLHERGVPTVTLISDMTNSPRAAFVGMDNRAAGRSAGLLLGRFIGARAQRDCKVALFAGSLAYRGHEEREMGFQHLLTETFPAIHVVALREGHDDALSNYRLARQLLQQHPDLAGIYNVGGASEGVARALAEAGRTHEVVFIGHGLTTETRTLLIDGSMDAVINVFPQTLVHNSVRVFSNLRDGQPPLTGVEPVRISIVLRENLP
jgi:LacI family transcriptional regulator